MDLAKLFCYIACMNFQNNKPTQVILKPKLTALVDAFLLFKYKHSSSERKLRYEEETRNERIARTMRLEGDNVSASDVSKFLEHKN